MIVTFGDRALIDQRIEDVGRGVLMVEEDAKRKLPMGTVISIGEPFDGLSSGDTVLFNDCAGEEVADTDGKKYLVVRTKDIIAKLC